jgi:ribonuclease HI
VSAKHVSTYGIYTDGSLQTSKDDNVNCGSGIYLSETGKGHNYTFDCHQTVLMAELVAILKAVTHEASPGEIERTIFTDSLNSLHDLHKMIHSPRKMRTHRYRGILSYILKKPSKNETRTTNQCKYTCTKSKHTSTSQAMRKRTPTPKRHTYWGTHK